MLTPGQHLAAAKKYLRDNDQNPQSELSHLANSVAALAHAMVAFVEEDVVDPEDGGE